MVEILDRCHGCHIVATGASRDVTLELPDPSGACSSRRTENATCKSKTEGVTRMGVGVA